VPSPNDDILTLHGLMLGTIEMTSRTFEFAKIESVGAEICRTCHTFMESRAQQLDEVEMSVVYC
jgi:glycine/serine hydroxymethyltransferase